MTPIPAHEQTRILVQAAAAACEEKKGENTRVLELDPVDSSLSDFFLVTSASNDRQAVAIADEVELRLKRNFGVYPNSVEGRRHGEWILLDYVDFVVHIFNAQRRAYYDLERLWKSAHRLTLDELLKGTKPVDVGVPAPAAKKAVKKTVKKAATKVARKAVKKSVKKTAKKAVRKPAAKKSAKKPAKKAAKKSSKR